MNYTVREDNNTVKKDDSSSLRKDDNNVLSNNSVYDLREAELISDSQVADYTVKKDNSSGVREDNNTGKPEKIKKLQYDIIKDKFWIGLAISTSIPIIGNVVYLLYQIFKANSLLNSLRKNSISINPFKKIKVEEIFQNGRISEIKNNDRENKNINGQEKHQI